MDGRSKQGCGVRSILPTILIFICEGFTCSRISSTRKSITLYRESQNLIKLMIQMLSTVQFVESALSLPTTIDSRLNILEEPFRVLTDFVMMYRSRLAYSCNVGMSLSSNSSLEIKCRRLQSPISMRRRKRPSCSSLWWLLVKPRAARPGFFVLASNRIAAEASRDWQFWGLR
jgi:hypothetical protein